MKKETKRITAFLLSAVLAFQSIFAVDIPFFKIYRDLMSATAEGDDSANPRDFSQYKENVRVDQEPTSDDGVSIDYVYARWLSSSDNADDPAGYGTLELYPDGQYISNHQFQIDFYLSGQESFAPGTVNITIPLSLWGDPENGSISLSFPKEPDKSAEFNWRIEGDQIIITNTKTLSSSTKVMLQGTYRDIDGTGLDDEKFSKDFNATVTVQTPNNKTIEKKSNDINIWLDTYTEIKENAVKSAFDSQSGTYTVYWEEIPSEIPRELLNRLSNPSDYVYVRWYVAATAEGSQQFKMTLSDTVSDIEYTDKNGNEQICSGIMLGATNCAEGTGTVISEDGRSIEATLYEGYSQLTQTAYVWTAYPKASFPEAEFKEDGSAITTKIKNQADITVQGTKGDDKPTSEHPSATAETKKPTKYFVEKEWASDVGEVDDIPEGRLPDSLDIEVRDTIANKLQENITLTEKGEWKGSWSDGGKKVSYEVTEKLNDKNYTDKERYDTDGNKYKEIWGYHRESEYDPDTHTWKFKNTYYESWEKVEISQLRKETDSNFTDHNTISMRDGLSLNKLLRGDTVTVPYHIEGVISKAEEYRSDPGKKSVFEITDDTFSLGGVQLNQNSDPDIEIKSVVLHRPEAYIYDDEADENERYAGKKLSGTDTPSLFLWGKEAKTGNYIKLAELKYDSGKDTWSFNDNETNSTYVEKAASTGNFKVDLKSGITGVKLQVEAAAAFVNLGRTTVELKIKPTLAVQELVNGANTSDYYMMQLINQASSNAKKNNSANSIAYLHGRDYKIAANLDKTFSVSNSGIYDRVLFTSKLEMTQQSNISAVDEFLEAAGLGEIPYSKGGIYYDLLPEGAEFDISSIKAGGNDNYTRVNIQQNYKSTGRTLVAIQVDFDDNLAYNQYGNPMQGVKSSHTLEFSFYMLKTDIWSYGTTKDRLNVAAFESAGDEVGTVDGWRGDKNSPVGTNHSGYISKRNALTGSGTNASRLDALNNLMSSMTNLSPTKDGAQNTKPVFLYSADVISRIDIDRSEVLGISKQVSTSASNIYSREVNVQEGGDYNYKLSVISESNTETTDIIIFDFLENYVPKETDDDYLNGSYQYTWNGTLESIRIEYDSTVTVEADPVVYYYTGDLGDLQDYDFSNNSGSSGSTDDERVQYQKAMLADWQSENLDAFLERLDNEGEDFKSSIKAIAVDLEYTDIVSKDRFKLTSEQSVSVYIYMKAPYKDDPYFDYEENPYVKDQKYFYDKGYDPDKNAHAFNKAYMCYKIIENGGVEETVAINSPEYTKVGIYTNYLEIEKIWSDDDNRDNLRPDNIVVYVYRGDESEPFRYQNGITLNDGNSWKAVIDRVQSYDENGNPYFYYCTETFADTYNGNAFRDAYKMRTGLTYHTNNNLTITLTNIHDPEKISIPVTKIWVDDVDANGKRPESISFSMLADGELTDKTLTIKPDSSGEWYGEFTDLFKFANDAGGPHKIAYDVVEAPVDNYVQTGKKAIDPSDPEKGFEFTNKFFPYGDLIVTKKVQNATPQAEDSKFPFSLHLENEDGTEFVNSYLYFIYDSKNAPFKPTEEQIEEAKNNNQYIGNGGTFELKDGQSILIHNIPHGVLYKVTELLQSGIGFTITYTENEEDTVSSWKPAEVLFENTYEAKGTAKIKAKKILYGQPLTGYQFRFSLWNDEACTDLFKTATNNPDGSISFSVSYSNKNAGDIGEHTYYLTEEDGKKSYYTYDKAEYKIEVKVDDIEGKGGLVCSVKYYRKENDDWKELTDPDHLEPEFTNNYYASGSIDLVAWKDIEGRELDPDSDKFLFELYRLHDGIFGRFRDKVENIGTVINFRNIEFNQDSIGKTYWYFAREKTLVDGEPYYNETIDYTNSIIGYKVTVIDNGDGTLSFDQRSYIMTDAFDECETCEGLGINKITGDQCSGCEGFGYTLKICKICKGFGIDAVIGTECPGCGGYGFIVKSDWSEPSKSETPLLVNGLQPGSLSVKKKVDTPNAPNIDFTFRVKLIGSKLTAKDVFEFKVVDKNGNDVSVGDDYISYNYNNIQSNEIEISFKLKAGQTITFKDIPAGTTYQVFENSIKDWIMEGQSNASGTIQPLTDESAATFENSYQPGKTSAVIVGVKYLDGKPAGMDSKNNKFKFSLYEVIGNEEKLIQEVEAQPGGLIQFKSIPYTQDDVKVHTYYVYEVEGTNPEISYDKHKEKITVEVTKDSDNNLHAVVKYGDGSDGDDGMMRFDNTTLPGDLEIEKVGEELTEQNKDSVFTFEVELSNDNGIPLNGPFNWYIIDTETGEIVWNSDYVTEATDFSDAAASLYSGVGPSRLNLRSAVKVGTGSFGAVKAIDDAPAAIAADPDDATPIPAAEYVPPTVAELEDWVSKDKATAVVTTKAVYKAALKVIHTNRKVKLYDDTEADEYVLVFEKGETGDIGNIYNTDNAKKFIYDNVGIYRESITAIVVKDRVYTTNCSCYMFSGFTKLVYADLTNFDLYNTKQKMSNLFENCTNLTKVIFDEKGIRASDISNMFSDCKNLSFYNIENFKFDYTATSSEQRILDKMFAGCTSLESVDLSGIDFGTCITVRTWNMFDNCTNLKTVNMSGWKAKITGSQATPVHYMFTKCSALQSVDISKWEMEITGGFATADMFYGAVNLKFVDMSKWNITNNGTLSLALMFGSEANSAINNEANQPYNLKTIDLSDFTLSGTGTMSMERMFQWRNKLEEIIGIEKFNTSQVTNMSQTFWRCGGLSTYLDLSAWDTSNVTDMKQMFVICSELKGVNVTGWDTSNVTNMANMFDNCKKLTIIDGIEGFDASSVKDGGIALMFLDCNALEMSLDLSGWGVTDKITNLDRIFSGCKVVTALDLSGWDTSNVTNFSQAFRDCNALESLNVSGWNTQKATDAGNIFTGWTSIREVTLTKGFYNYPSMPEFPTPNIYKQDPYTGTWIMKGKMSHAEDEVYTSAQLKANYASLLEDDKPSTFVWHKACYNIVFKPKADNMDYTWTGSMPPGWSPADEGYALPANQFIAMDGNERLIFQGWIDQNGKSYTADSLGYASIPAGTYYPTGTAVPKKCMTVTLTADWAREADIITFRVEHWLENLDEKLEYNGYTEYKLVKDSKVTINPIMDYEDFIIPEPIKDLVVTEDLKANPPKFEYYRFKYKVILHGNGGTTEKGSEQETVTMIVDRDKELSNHFNREGYVFIGWNTKADGSGDSYSADSSVSISGAENGKSYNLYAQWFNLSDVTIDTTVGKFTVSCKAGQTIVIKGLPASTKYTVTELTTGDYMPGGWSLKGYGFKTKAYDTDRSDDNGIYGTIRADFTSHCTATNVYSAKGHATIEAHKKLIGGELGMGQFLFMLSEENDFSSVQSVGKYHTGNYDDYGYLAEKITKSTDQENEAQISNAKKLHVSVSYNVIGDNAAVYVYKGDPSATEPIAVLNGENGKATYVIEGDHVYFKSEANDGLADYYAEVFAETDNAQSYFSTAYNIGETDDRETVLDDDGNVKENPWYDTSSVTFEPIEFTKEGEFTYYIREATFNGTNYEYVTFDKSIYKVVVTMTDNGNGTLRSDVSYYYIGNEEPEEGALFTNAVMTTLTVTQTGDEGYESFIYRVINNDTGEELTVSVTRGGETTIVVPIGNYTVVEMSDWSWRYEYGEPEPPADSDVESVADESINGKNNARAYVDAEGEIFPFSNDKNGKIWLGGENYKNNHYATISSY